MEYDATLSYHGINFGLMEGKTGLLIVKTGSGGSIYGKDNKYLRLSERMKSVYGASVIVSDNPLEIAKGIRNQSSLLSWRVQRWTIRSYVCLSISMGYKVAGTQYAIIHKLASFKARTGTSVAITTNVLTFWRPRPIISVCGNCRCSQKRKYKKSHRS